MALKSDKFGLKVLFKRKKVLFFLLDNDWFHFDKIG